MSDTNNDKDDASLTGGSPGFLAELKKRKVFRVAITYAIVGWIVIQVADTTLPYFGIPEWAMRLVILAVVLGLVIAVALAWSFDLTPAGLLTAEQAAASELHDVRSANPVSMPLATVAVVTVSAIALGLLAFYFNSQEPQVSEMPVGPAAITATPSIAVLPFDNRSSQEDDQYFVDGIHDDLLTQIAHIGGIKTISRTSVLAYRDTTKNLRAIGEELGVTTILEGGVQRSGNEIRINVQLIDAATDVHLWAQTYTREMTAENVFRIQSDISTSIASALDTALRPSAESELDRLPTQSLAALESYFRGKSSEFAFTAEGKEQSAKAFKEAIAKDPEFADAYAFLASVYLSQIYFNGLPAAEQVQKAEPLIARALELDSDLSRAYAAQGVLLRYQGNYDKAAVSFERALELNPNEVEAHLDYANMLLWKAAKPGRAAELFGTATELDPQNWGAKQQLSEALMFTGSFDEAERIMLQLVEDDFSRPQPHAGLARLYAWFLSRYDDSLREARIWFSLDQANPFAAFAVAEAYGELGLLEESVAWYRRSIGLTSDSGNLVVLQSLMARVLGKDTDASNLREQVRLSADLNGYALVLSVEEAIQKTDYDKLIRMVEYTYPDLTGQRGVTWEQMFVVPDYVAALLHVGSDARAQRIAARAFEYLAVFPDIHAELLRANLYSALARSTEAQDAFQAFVMAGGCLSSNHPSFYLSANQTPATLSSEAYIDSTERCIAEQRDQVQQWERAGELAPIPRLPGEAQ